MRVESPSWWHNAAVYQIYPRSFQDSDGDGIGDLPGIIRRLDHLLDLGIDAIWLSPIYPSPLADGGYDVADHAGVDSRLGTVDDLAALADACHRRGLGLLLDLVPNHTSIQHPWFRRHPDRYVWADRPANNWRAAFGGPAWTRDAETGRYYLHSFFPEQPDLDWRNPEVPAAMQEIIRVWLARGVDGFRIDALDRIGKDPQLRDDPPAGRPFALPLDPESQALDHRHSRNVLETLRPALAALRAAAGSAFLVGEAYVPTEQLPPYLEHLDSAFAFEFLFAPWRAEALAGVIDRAAGLGRAAWVLSNHDFGRLGSRVGEANQRAAALLLLTLPGPTFIYQGDEIGLMDGPGADPPVDRFGRDRARHPMQWDATRSGGFSDGSPWLPMVDPAVRNVADQRRDPGSLLSFHRALLRLRRELDGPVCLLEADADGLLTYARGTHVMALNLGSVPRRVDLPGEVVLGTHPDATPALLAPSAGIVVRSAASHRPGDPIRRG